MSSLERAHEMITYKWSISPLLFAFITNHYALVIWLFLDGSSDNFSTGDEVGKLNLPVSNDMHDHMMKSFTQKVNQNYGIK